MPSSVVKSFASKTGKSVEEVERLWKIAKQSATEKFSKSSSEFDDSDWKYVTGTLKKMLGLTEQKKKIKRQEDFSDIEAFIESTLSVEEFLEEGPAVTSSSFSVINKEPKITISKKKPLGKVVDEEDFLEPEEEIEESQEEKENKMLDNMMDNLDEYFTAGGHAPITPRGEKPIRPKDDGAVGKVLEGLDGWM